jgi:hypothetical protein
MAQVAILVNGTPDPRKTEIASALGILLGCPVLQPSKLQDALTQQTGPVAPRAGIRALAIDTVWRVAALVEAGVVIDATWDAADAEAVLTSLRASDAPRLVEVRCGDEPAIGEWPVVRVASLATVDMDALVQEISALFV